MRFAKLAVPVALLAVAVVLVPAAVLAGGADCARAKAASTASAEKPCCSGHADTATAGSSCGAKAELIAKAKAGSEEAMASLIAMAKDSGCPIGTALAAKAEAGDQAAKEQLLDMCGAAHAAEPSPAMLASNAKMGCVKSAEALVALAKASGDEKSAALAAKAESGDEKAKAELIAMYEKPAPGAN
jgi:hypothetical protein